MSVPPPGRRVSQPRWRSRITWGAGLLLVVGGLLVARLIAGPVALATSGYEDGVMRGGLHSGSLISPPPGRLITHRPLAGTGLRGHAFRITYHSRTVGNADIAVTGLVVLPFGAPPPGGWPIITYGHSTTGIADVCAPSAHLGWAPTDVWNALLDRRMAIAATDYEGLGGPGRHPYLVGTSEAHSMIDAVRAARQLSRGRIGTRYMALGHSQGGHAAVFTAVNAFRWAPQLQLLGVVVVAPVSDLATFVEAGAMLNPDVFALMLASGFSSVYPRADPALFLRSEAVRRLPLVDKSCDFGRAFVDVPGGVKARPVTATPVWRELLASNGLGSQHVDAPMLLIHGLNDRIITADMSASLFTRLCGTGDVVVAKFIPGLDHGSIMNGSMTVFIPWIQDRFTGRRVTSGCSDRAGVPGGARPGGGGEPHR